ncbi:porin [Burkholderia multivorans]|uniref:porin n=1 Tax=Burkholderia multivorans TaxID=87883 RepID=UPI002019E0C1|nr:porin [Burkholderia multivorans]MCO1368660.1 porin [Burkholderia multivorans]MCO1380551.1 porin [Burkholderia multivorans]MDN8032084.1 porin [Burkholderia multivorans]UQP22022.1 porin [Burkholderia multivorans]UQP91530.1 porin [Burkholderia multivorans]
MKFKSRRISHIVGVSVLLCACGAHAQSSVTLFGAIDAGVSYVSNKGGSSLWQASDGINGPNLWGLIGYEDLGGGTKAIFNLINQFLLYSGAFLNHQSLFTRTAFVGLTNDRWGTLTFGNQYDFVNDYLYAVGNDPALYTGHLYGQYSGPYQNLTLPLSTNGDSDWFRASGRFANSVKYVSPTYAGFSGAAMYAFGNAAGSMGTGNAQSFALNYANGPLGANVVYTFGRYPETVGSVGPQTSIQKIGAGARYKIGSVNFSGMYLGIRNTTTGQMIYQVTPGVNWLVRPDISLSGSYAYVKGNAVLNSAHGHQFAAIAEYFFSKRTSVYVMSVYQRASSGALASITGTGAISDSQNQLVARIGMKTRF